MGRCQRIQKRAFCAIRLVRLSGADCHQRRHEPTMNPSAATALERALRRDRLIVIIGLAGVVALAAIYTVLGIGMSMSAVTMTRMAIEMPGMMMASTEWTPRYAALVFLMWWVMMIAMMVPSAAPTVLLYANLVRKSKAKHRPYAPVSVFLAGYLIVWAGFSLAATLAQWLLVSIGHVSGMMEITHAPIAAGLLVAAGLYQLSPLKQACLRHCQHPLVFLMHNWKPGNTGALRMGMQNGLYCLGCCWVLMALLFVGGVMNLLWIAGLAMFVGVEKLAAHHRWFVAVSAVGLIVAGVVVGVRG